MIGYNALLAIMRTGISAFSEQLRLAEKAAEDIYFARLDRELIELLHNRMREERPYFQFSHLAPDQDREPNPPRCS